MSKLKVIKGSSRLKDFALDIYPYALQYYGDRYKNVIDDSLNHTVLYECDNESPKEILEEVMGETIVNDMLDFRSDQYDFKGFHFILEHTASEFSHVVVVKNIGNEDDMKAVLTHELYGHAVCGHDPVYVTSGNDKLERNGISIIDDNDLANEGLIEYIARKIIDLYNPKYVRSEDMETYVDCISLANQLFKYIGKEKMLELMVHYKYNINELFDSNNRSSWDKLSLDLEKHKNIDEHIDSFIKRYKYNR